MSASGVRMTTRQIYCRRTAGGDATRHRHEPGTTIQSDLHQPTGGDIRNGWLVMLRSAHEGVLQEEGPHCCATAAIVILLMLAGLRLAQTDSETMDREGGGMVSCG